MKPSTGSDADPLRRPLLNTSGGVHEERLGYLSPPCRASEKPKQTYDGAKSRSEQEMDSILSLEGVSSWAPPQHYPRLERQRTGSAEKLQAVQLTSSTAEIEQRSDISARKGTSATIGKKQARTHSTIRNTTATRNQLSLSTCQDSPLPGISTASPTAFLPRDEQQKTVHVFETSEVDTLEEMPLNQTQCPAPTQTPPFLIIRAEDTLPAHSEVRHSTLTHLCFNCLSRAQRAGWRMLRTCRDCSTAFWWLLSPLFLLFTWFCWHGVHALWKVSSRGPGHWLSAEEESVVHDYGLVIDAGSHGSRLSIYSWKPRLFDPTHPFTGPVSFPKLCFRGNPQGALTSPLQVPSILSALIDQGTEFFHFRARIPELRWSDFPLYVKATGGMRNMEQAPRDILMETVRDYLENRQFNPFRFKRAWARVLAGEEEGVYGWLAVNNGRNSLIDDPARTTGALDLGGASAQITFFPTHTSVLEDLTLVRLGDRTIRLYSHSYLGYGWGDALSRVSTDLAVEALLRRIKANPRFITENMRAARALAVSPDGQSIWEETIPPLDTFKVFASAVRRSSTIQRANSEIPRICPTKDTRGSLVLREAREVRRLSAEVDNKEEADSPRATKRIRKGSVNGKSSNALSTELEKKAKAIDTKTEGGKSWHFVGRKRRKGRKERVDLSRQQQRKGKAVERSGETKEGGILSLRRQPETSFEEKRNTHIPDFSSADDEGMSRSQDADISPREIQESEPHDTPGFLRPQQDVWKGVGAKEVESGFSQEGSKQQISSPAAAARLFLLRGEKKRRDNSTNRPSTEGSKPLWKKQELQYGRTAFRWARRRTAAAAASPPGDNEINEKVESERHQPGFSNMNEEQLPGKVSTEEGTNTELSHENEDSAGIISRVREKGVDEEGLSGLVESAEKTMTSGGTEKPVGEAGFAYELVFTVEHPCFPRGTVYDFPFPLLSYPERRYYVDISVNNIEAYMRAARYAEHDIQKILKTVYPHSVDNHRATQGPVSDKLPPQQHHGGKAAKGGSNFFSPEVHLAQQTPPSHQSHLKQVNSESKQMLQRAGRRIPEQQELVESPFDETQHSARREERERHVNVKQAITSGNNQSSSSAENSSFPDSDAQGKNDTQVETNVIGTNFSSFPLAAASAPPAAASVYDGKKASERESGDATVVAADIHREDGSSATTAAGITTLPDETIPAAHAMKRKRLKDETPGGEGQQRREKKGKRPKGHLLRDQEKTISGEEDIFTAKMKPEIHFIARFVGSGDFDACHARAKKYTRIEMYAEQCLFHLFAALWIAFFTLKRVFRLFHKSFCFMNSCSFNGVYQPRLENSKFLAFGQYSKVHAAMGLPPNAPLSAFFEGAKDICSQRVRQLQLKRRLQGFSALVYSKKSVEKLCWKAIWSYAMLRQGFGFAASSTRISFAPLRGDSAAGPAPEWATGSMIAEVNSYPWEVPPETYEGPFHLATAFLIMSVILALILYHEMHWMRRRLRDSQRREPTGNGDVVVWRRPAGDGIAPAGKLRGQVSLDG